MRVIARHLAREVVGVDVSSHGQTLIIRAACGMPRVARQMLESLRRQNAERRDRKTRQSGSVEITRYSHA